MEKKPLSYFVVGTILGMVSIIVFLAYYFTGLAFQGGFTSLLPYAISAGILVYFVVQYSNANRNNITFGGLFGYGFKSTIIWSLIVFVFTLLTLYIIFPDYKEKALAIATAEMEKDSKLSEEQKDMGLRIVENSFNIVVLGGGLFFNILTGIIGSLLGAAVAKKNPVSPFTQTV